MLKNMKIKTLLIFAFAIICFSASAVTVTSFFGFQFLKKDFSELKDDTWPQTIMANQIYKNINEIARAIRNIALLDNKEGIEKERKRIEKAMAAINDIIAKFDKMALDNKEKQMIAEIVDAKGKYNAIQAEALKKIDDGNKKEVITFLIEKVRPVQATYFKAVDEFIEHQNAQMEQSANAVGKTVNTMQMAIVLLATLGTIIALFIAFFTIRIIIQSLNKAVVIANRVGEGDFT